MTSIDRFLCDWLETLHAALMVEADHFLSAADDRDAIVALNEMAFILRRMAFALEPQ